MLKLSAKEKENALNEVRILASIKHPNIIAYKETFFDDPSSSLWYAASRSLFKPIATLSLICSIVMEYANNGDLLQKIQKH